MEEYSDLLSASSLVEFEVDKLLKNGATIQKNGEKIRIAGDGQGEKNLVCIFEKNQYGNQVAKMSSDVIVNQNTMATVPSFTDVKWEKLNGGGYRLETLEADGRIRESEGLTENGSMRYTRTIYEFNKDQQLTHYDRKDKNNGVVQRKWAYFSVDENGICRAKIVVDGEEIEVTLDRLWTKEDADMMDVGVTLSDMFNKVKAQTSSVGRSH